MEASWSVHIEIHSFFSPFFHQSLTLYKINTIFYFAGRFYDKFTEYFIGGGPQLRAPEVIFSGTDRFRLNTEPMGTVHLELNIIQKNFKKYGVETY